MRTAEDLMACDDRVVLLLGDIGVFGFRHAFERFPERTFNIGICEQAMTGVAAGLAKEGLIPIVHSIAPFVAERCFEQLKVDVCYQQQPINIVSVGASYDYAALGCTHHCPADVTALKTLPGMEVVVPGTPSEYDRLFRAAYGDGQPTYFRLSERGNHESHDVEFGLARVIRVGNLATIVAVGPMLTPVMEATAGLDVTIVYYTTVSPFDGGTLREALVSDCLVLVEPFYEGTLTHDVMTAMQGRRIRCLDIGVPRRFLTSYGRAADLDVLCGLTSAQIGARVRHFMNE